MAQISCTLTATYKPAFYALVETVQQIAAAEGEDQAAAFATTAFDHHFDLFISVAVERERPTLRLIEGGR